MYFCLLSMHPCIFLVYSCVASVGIWAEEEFSKEFDDNIESVQGYISSNSSISSISSVNASYGDTYTLDDLTEFEDLRCIYLHDCTHI